MTVSKLQAGKENEFLDDLREVIAVVSRRKQGKLSDRLISSAVSGLSGILPERSFRGAMDFASRFIGSHGSGQSDSAAMYGITASIRNKKNVRQMVLSIYDKMYRPYP